MNFHFSAIFTNLLMKNYLNKLHQIWITITKIFRFFFFLQYYTTHAAVLEWNQPAWIFRCFLLPLFLYLLYYILVGRSHQGSTTFRYQILPNFIYICKSALRAISIHKIIYTPNVTQLFFLTNEYPVEILIISFTWQFVRL